MLLTTLFLAIIVGGKASSDIYDSSTCGKSVVFPRRHIKGGRVVISEELPWVVGVTLPGGHCSGVLISRKHVLTSATCVKSGIPLSSYQVLMIGMCATGCGHPNLYYKDVVKVSLYEDFATYGRVLNNIALFELDSLVSKAANHICLPTRSFPIDEQNDDIMASGVGYRFDGGSGNRVDRVDLGKRYNSNRTKLTKLRPNVDVLKGEFAVVSTGRKAVCNFDQGGPGSTIINERHVLVGLIARSSCPFDRDAQDVAIGYFTDVVHWLPRIQAAMNVTLN